MITIDVITALFLLAGTQVTAPTVSVQTRVLWPGEKFIASEKISIVIMKTDGVPLTDVSILHQGVPLTAGAVSVGGKFGSLLHARIDLLPGTNSLIIQAGRKKIGERSVFLADPFEEQSEAPPGFSHRDFHVRQTETLCSGCHFKKDGEECAQCHGRLGTQKVVHAPVQGDQCDLCHGRAKTEPSRFALLSRPPGLCLQCHENIKDALDKKPYRHGPASAGECTLCHSPHSSDVSFLLRRKAFDLCTSCHVEKKDGKHMIAGFTYGESHPVGAPGEPRRDDPTQPGVEFSCASCHDPHASLVQTLWRFDTKDRFGLCQACHQK